MGEETMSYAAMPPASGKIDVVAEVQTAFSIVWENIRLALDHGCPSRSSSAPRLSRSSWVVRA
jgi:hypothetical protein